jgi:hypothetical protein
MRDDPIVEEVRKARDTHAKKFNYDLEAIVADLIKQQGTSGKKLVSFPPRKLVMVKLHQHAPTALADEKGKYKTTK